MKIQLLSPAGEIHRNTTGIFKTSLRYAPLTLTTLAALVPEELNAEITIQDEGVQPLDLDFPPSLVGITRHHRHGAAGLSTSPIELRAKGHTVVIGGVHRDAAARRGRPARRRHGDQATPRNRGRSCCATSPRGRLKTRYFTPTGKRPGRRAASRAAICSRRSATPPSTVIEATRGCPHKCDFCVVPAAWANIYAHRPDRGSRRRAAHLRGPARPVHRPQPGRGRALRQGTVPGHDPAAHPLGRSGDDAHRRGR